MNELQLGLDAPDITSSKAIGRIVDKVLNTTLWTKCVHHFTTNNVYSYTDIFHMNGDIHKFVIIDENGKLNPKYDITSNSTASYLRLQLYNLIHASYQPENFTENREIRLVFEHPYLAAEWCGTVTTRIEFISLYRGELTAEQEQIVANYEVEKERLEKERERERDEKIVKFKTSSQFDAKSSDVSHVPSISSTAPFIDSSYFYEAIKLDGINIKFNGFVVNHAYINSIKKAFISYNKSRYDIDIKWLINPTKPCYYKYGVNQTTEEFNEKFYIFFNDSVVSRFFTSKIKLGKSLSWKLYYWTIGLLYINGRLNDDTNIDDIFFWMMIFIEKYFIQNNVHAIEEINDANRNDIKMMSIEKLISNIKQYQREIDILDVLNFIRGKTKNGCLFPDNWSTEEKREWKERNGIERKEHSQRNDKGQKRERYTMSESKNEKLKTLHESNRGKSYRKSAEQRYNEEIILKRILELRNEGLTLEKIANEIGMSKKTIIRKLKECEKNLIL